MTDDFKDNSTVQDQIMSELRESLIGKSVENETRVYDNKNSDTSILTINDQDQILRYLRIIQTTRTDSRKVLIQNFYNYELKRI